MKVLVLDIWGDYAHFRKFYTTSSPLTFSFPPPSTIVGILGAICGIGKDEYLRVFSLDRCKIALKIVNPVEKVRMGINLINTKGGRWILYSNQYHEPRTQIRTEFLKEPYFRIYFVHENKNIFKKLAGLLKEHKNIYTVSLGLSELLADFKYVNEYDSEQKSDNGFVELQTPVTETNLIQNGLEIESGKKYFKEKMPIKMNPERIVEKYDDVIFEPDGKVIKAKVKEFYRIENGENITFF
jgi:CRISPR-associated protein Cas5h